MVFILCYANKLDIIPLSRLFYDDTYNGFGPQISHILVVVPRESHKFLFSFPTRFVVPQEKQSPFEGFDRFDRDDGPRGLLSLSGDA